MLDSFIVIISEIALALYPILIKTVPTNLASQILARLLTYSILGFVLANQSDVLQTWATGDGIIRSTLLGLLTLAHIGTSYYAFQELPAGVSMSLFYTYPIWNILGASLFFGESFSIMDIFLVMIGFFGVLFIAMSQQEDSANQEKEVNWKGFLSGLLAAFTESLIYFAVRTAKVPSPFYAILELYPAALFALIAMFVISQPLLDFRPKIWSRMIFFNTLVGFVGYCLRFYAIPRLPTLIFSLLSLIGVMASFLWGYVFVGEKPTLYTGIGAALISGAAAFAKT
jgi:drug/metabolite transporter (DMT)-like permease